jgi:hypothetical protein
MSALFGLDESNRLVFVSEVPRGLACKCRCVACEELLIARQGALREHHFAHASGREPCEASHESLLHRYAKQVIQEAGGLTVPIDLSVTEVLGMDACDAQSAHLTLPVVEVEKGFGQVRPDLLAHTEHGVVIAIEVAYSSFCDQAKVDQFVQIGLPALEIDLRAFTPDAFEPAAVRNAVLHEVSGKTWLCPRPPASSSTMNELPPLPPPKSGAPRRRLPEEIVTISGRWVSIKEFPSGDISVRVVTYDPDVVSMVKSIAKANSGRYAPGWKSWNVPRWRAAMVRAALRSKAETVSIVLKDQR